MVTITAGFFSQGKVIEIPKLSENVVILSNLPIKTSRNLTFFNTSSYIEMKTKCEAWELGIIVHYLILDWKEKQFFTIMILYQEEP